MTTLADAIRVLRKRRHLTQEQLAVAATISKDSVSRVERGENVTLDTIDRIAHALDFHGIVPMCVAAASATQPDELRLVRLFRTLSHSEQRALMQHLTDLLLTVEAHDLPR